MACSTSFQSVRAAVEVFGVAATNRRTDETISSALRMERSFALRFRCWKGIVDDENAAAVGVARVGISSIGRDTVRATRGGRGGERREGAVRADRQDCHRRSTAAWKAGM